jgi:hypothetical protein
LPSLPPVLGVQWENLLSVHRGWKTDFTVFPVLLESSEITAFFRTKVEKVALRRRFPVVWHSLTPVESAIAAKCE